MRNIIFLWITLQFFLIAVCLFPQLVKAQVSTSPFRSPDGNICLRLEEKGNAWFYSILYKNKTIIATSALGLKTNSFDLYAHADSYLITDGADPGTFSSKKCSSKLSQEIDLKPNGGFVLTIK